MRFKLASLPLVLALIGGCGGESSESSEVPEPTQAPDTPSEGTPSTGHDVPSLSGQLTVVFTNNLDGEIEPCG